MDTQTEQLTPENLPEQPAKEQELNLDDIMKEFADAESGDSSQDESVPVPDVETILAEQSSSDDAQFPPSDTEPTESTEKAATSVTGDTIRLEAISEVLSAQETSVASPVEEEASASTQPPESSDPSQQAAAEEEVFIPAPIPFRPKQRLRELKKKLIAGPEKRYYDLSEMGTGKLQLSIFLNLIIVALCAAASAYYAGGLIPENRMRFLIFSQILAMLVSGLLGCYCLLDGVTDLFHGKFSLNTMLVLTFLACGADAFFCLRELRVPCCAAFCLEVTMALWNRLQLRNTEMGEMDTMRKATRLDSVVKSPDFYENRPGILRGEGQVEHFMDTYSAISAPEHAQHIFALVSFLLCLGIAALAGIRHGLSMAFQILAPAMLMAIPASFFVSLSRPMAVLERRLHMVGTVLCGWQGVKGLSGKAVFPIRDADLFPTGSVKLNGVKFYGNRTPEDAIAYSAALMEENGGALAPVFRELLKSKGGFLYQVENFRSYPSGGVGGEVCKEPVLIGTLSFLQDMGVEIPEGTMVNQAVYCSIDGQLSAVFAISYGKLKSSAAGLVSLCANRKLHCVMLCEDFMLTDDFLRSKFSVSARRIRFPNREERHDLSARKPADEDVPLALTTQDGLTPVAYAISGARALRTALRIGLWLHMFAGALGMLIMAALAYLGNTELLTPLNIFLYQLVWMIPGLLVTCWTYTV